MLYPAAMKWRTPLGRVPLLLLLLLALLGAPLPPAAQAGDGPAPAEVAQAVERGAAWLTQQLAGAFADERFTDVGELVVLTLAHAGANTSNKTFAAGLAWLEAVEPRFTYRTALQAMALSEVNPRLYRRSLAHGAQWLVDTQLPGGEWGYPGAAEAPGQAVTGFRVAAPAVPTGPGGKPADGRLAIVRGGGLTADRVLRGDFSNTQFAVLGLRACREAGIDAPKATWQGALDYLRRFQRPDGGWGYVVQGEQDSASYASLTCAGICSTAICLNALGTKDVRADAGVKKALAWLDKHLDLTRNAGIDESAVLGFSPWQYYHLYSLERAGRVLGLDTLGKRAWYPEGARWLLGAQQGDGSWADAPLGGSRPRYLTPADTCFAILFLTRATRPITK